MLSRVFEQHPTVSDNLSNRIISGKVLVKPNIREFTETSAIFDDGTREEIDAVVFATGYSFSFPFLEGYVKVVENQIPLYKFMFPPDLEKPTLAFIGLIQPLGPIMPISELQCRWATRVFKGKRGRVGGCSQAPQATARLSCSSGGIPSHTASLHSPLLSSFCLFISTKTTVAFCSEPRAHLFLWGPLTGSVIYNHLLPRPLLLP